MAANRNLSRDREILSAAQARGPAATFFSYFRLSGPGWLQSAITLGGGSLTSALFLGVLGGYEMLWLQWIAIVLGVIMLSAISYVTLSSHLRPFDAINRHINPILGTGWLLATLMANVIWCMPQFSLCYDAIDNGLLPESSAQTAASSAGDAQSGVSPTAASLTSVSFPPVQSDGSETESDASQASLPVSGDQGETSEANSSWQFREGTLTVDYGLGPVVVDQAIRKVLISLVLFSLALTMVIMSASGGWASWWFDVLLKFIIGVIVLCFFGTVIYLTRESQLPWNEILVGLIPNPSHWYSPSGTLAELLEQLPDDTSQYWEKLIVDQQKDVMISTVATAVGINMTFLLPYSLLARGWDRTFRGLARFDLIFGMLIPFILVTSCVVITSSAAFHAQADAQFLDTDAAVVAESPLLNSGDLKKNIANRYQEQLGNDFENQTPAIQRERLATTVAGMPEAERRVIASLVKRNSFELSSTLAPLFTAAGSETENGEPASLVPGLSGAQLSSLIFSIGALAMGFSTMIILMLINGYVFAELFQSPPGSRAFILGAVIAGVAGASWPLIWQGESKLWLAISASTFGFLLLPIAYFAFWLLMNNKSVLGDDRPEGARRIFWNILLLVSLITTLVAAAAALWDKLQRDPVRGQLILGAVCCFVLLAIIGFFASNRQTSEPEYDPE